MGSGHSHPAHPNHRLRREKCSTQGAMCGLCHRRIELGEMAYRCAAAECTAFFLHDACYRYPERIKAKGHFSAGHSLALTARADVAGGACTVCAMTLDGFSHVYTCSKSRHFACGRGGFLAHPRCGNLPPQAGAPSHPHQLFLRAPDGGGGVRRCVECNAVAAGGGGGGRQVVRAWSYQCQTCPDSELCLACALGRDGVPPCCCCGQCVCGGGCFVGCAGLAGNAMGHFIHELFRGCTGLSFKSAMGTARPPA